MTEKNSVRFNAEIVNGKCPTCDEITMLVSVACDYYRCVTCGADMQQHINGKISYLPILPSSSDYRVFVKDWVDGQS
jgi:Zn ribbon nucleic-acid-binding protein